MGNTELQLVSNCPEHPGIPTTMGPLCNQDLYTEFVTVE
jgi:hypothetical protein